ncbi:MAG: L-2-hydroxyglutarate oxidase [Pirellulales bacterium]
MRRADLIIIGGGIVGLATAFRFSERFPDKTALVLEKEPEIASHQTGHNSGVLHTGIYYKPGSLKAINCRQGKQAMEAFCQSEGIPYQLCGKVVVAVDPSELPALEQIQARGEANGVRCERIGPQRLAEIEPHAAGLEALYVPEAGVVDYRHVCERLAARIEDHGTTIVTAARVIGLRAEAGGVVVSTTAGNFGGRYVVNCAGLHSDRVTQLSGQKPEARIVPFRGEYYRLLPKAESLCRALIYPVPDPKFPFLGVHFTRRIDGSVECGPNAVLAFAREGYRKRDVNIRDLTESLTYPGFLKLAARFWRTGAGEYWRSLSKRAFVRALSRLIPEIRTEHLEAAPAGVRAQAVTRDGALVDDFLFQQTERVIHVGNAPSPAATASLNIGTIIVDKLATRFG